MSTPLAIALVALILFFFVALWLLVTTLLCTLSGWSGLARRYPDRDEAPRIELRGQSGSMGMGVQFRGILTLAACPSGLRVAIWRAFAPFGRPFLVPWVEIEARPGRALFVEMTRLGFGTPESGTLMIAARTWEHLSSTPSRERATEP